MIVTSVVNDRPIALHALELCRDAHIPAIVYGNAPELRSFDRVFTDHRAGARDLTNWLLGRGCRRIVPFFPVAPSKYWMRERLEGYAEAMRAAGLEPLPCAVSGDAVLAANAEDESHFPLFRALAVAKIVELQRNGGVDALLCYNDEWAKPAIAAIRELGLEPNRDILVAGYDNVTQEAGFGAFEPGKPAITMDKHNEKTAAELAALLVARMDGALPPEPQMRTHDQELIENVR